MARATRRGDADLRKRSPLHPPSPTRRRSAANRDRQHHTHRPPLTAAPVYVRSLSGSCACSRTCSRASSTAWSTGSRSAPPPRLQAPPCVSATAASGHAPSLSQLLYIFLGARDARPWMCILPRPSVMAVSELTPSPTLQDFSTTWASETFVVVPGAGQMVLACPQQIFADDGSDDPPLAPVPPCSPAPRKQGGARLRCAPRITLYELPLTDPVPAYGSPYAERCGTHEGRKTRQSSRRRRSMGASRCAAPQGVERIKGCELSPRRGTRRFSRRASTPAGSTCARSPPRPLGRLPGPPRGRSARYPTLSSSSHSLLFVLKLFIDNAPSFIGRRRRRSSTSSRCT